MKKVLATILLTTALLSACGGSSSNSSTNTASDTPRYVSTSSSDFSIDVPDTWQTINNFTGDYPEGIRMAFKNNVQNSSFTANVNVIREDNPSQLTSADFEQQELQNHKDHLLNYTLISQESVTLKVAGADSATLLDSFSGQNTTDGPTLDFMQVVLCKADRAWVVTAAYLPDEDQFTIQKMQHMLNSFAVR